MRITCAPYWLGLAVFSAFVAFSFPALAEDHVQMQQAMDLVDKAWNPGGSPPPDAQRIAMLKQALSLLNQDPFTGYQGHKTKAIRYINSAIVQINLGDPDNKVFNYLQDAEHQMRDAIADAD